MVPTTEIQCWVWAAQPTVEFGPTKINVAQIAYEINAPTAKMVAHSKDEWELCCLKHWFQQCLDSQKQVCFMII